MTTVPMIACSVFGCNNSTLTTDDPTIQYHYFPKHPEIAEHWINSSIWKTDQLDLDSARVCSAHFDADSYTDEYKKSEFLSGYYTKVLKFDAVPNVNLSYQAIIKTAVPESIQQIQGDPGSSALKPIIVFNLNEAETFSTYETSIAEAHTVDVSGIKFVQDVAHIQTVDQTTNGEVLEPPVENLELYKNIDTYDDYVKLKNENSLLEDNIAQLEERVAHLREVCRKKTEAVQEREGEVRVMKRKYNAAFQKTLSFAEKKQVLAKVFSEPQIKILAGKKKIYWSNDDMAVGWTIRNMSNKRCYMYLSKTLNFPLPALSSIKRWACTKKSNNRNEKQDCFQDSE